MPVFPLFIPIQDKDVLVIGAGPVAARKIEKLIPFGPKIRVVAKNVSPDAEAEILAWERARAISLARRPFEHADLEGAEIVIVAADDLQLQKEIFDICTARRVPCNSVDSPAYCSFIFPALVQRGDLIMGISTGGKAPGLSGRMRRYLDGLLPTSISAIVESISALRSSQEHRQKPSFAERAKAVLELTDSLFRPDRNQPSAAHTTKSSPQDE